MALTLANLKKYIGIDDSNTTFDVHLRAIIREGTERVKDDGVAETHPKFNRLAKLASAMLINQSPMTSLIGAFDQTGSAGSGALKKKKVGDVEEEFFNPNESRSSSGSTAKSEFPGGSYGIEYERLLKSIIGVDFMFSVEDC